MQMSGRQDAFAGGGQMGALIGSTDWSRRPLGPIETWPQSLRSVLSVCLTSRQPMGVLWGEPLLMLYNDAYVPILGEKHPRAVGQPLQEIWPEAWPVLGPIFKSVRNNGEAAYNEEQPLMLFRRGFHEETYFTFSFSPLRDETGSVGGIVFILTETTQRVLGQRRLHLLTALGSRASSVRSTKEALAEVRAVLAEWPAADIPFAALYLCDAAGRTARRALVVGTQPAGRISPEDVALDAPDAPDSWPVAQVISTRDPVVVDGLRIRTQLPVPEPAEHRGTALVLPIRTHGDGQPTAVLVAAVSPHVPLDDGLRDFVKLVAAQISSALVNATAYEEERRRAEALARLDTARTAFFSNVSHELRTPLTLILGPLADALRSPEQALRGEGLEIASRNGERLLRLVNDLLEFSRLEAGHSAASFEATDLAALTEPLACSFRPAAERAGLELVVDCTRLPEPVYVDRGMWEKIVLNLLSNALKFTHRGGIVVRLRQGVQDVQLEVEDTGTGIPVEELPHIFERFYRVRGAEARTHEGTGIGLALVKELVGLHGGTVRAESEVGRGTRFVVCLPRGRVHLPKEWIQPEQRATGGLTRGSAAFAEEARRWIRDASGQETAAPSVEAAAGVAGRVLVVDDNADMRDYLRAVLNPQFEVELAVDGLGALEATRRRLPDVIVSDVMMPRLDGLGLLQQLRQEPATQAVPVILLSARAGEEATVDGLGAGADDYLVKPFSAQELLARVRSLLELTRMRREVARRDAIEAGLRAAVQARDDFLSLASHELKTPLTNLCLQIDVTERQLNEQQAGVVPRLAVARRFARRLAGLVESMLDVSEINHGHLQLRLEETELRALVADEIAHAQADAARAGSSIVLHVEGSTIVGHLDRTRIGQVIATLLSNAVKFGAGGRIEVSLRTAGGFVRLTVTDHGIGIAPEDRARIFERFERAVSSRTYGGLGLGLWIARRMVEAHSGHIEVEETPGGGSSFHVLLPLSPAGTAR